MSAAEQLTINALSHEGRGIARVAGKVAFVAGALPGERIEARCTVRHKRFDEYQLIRVLTPSPQRVVPECPLVGRCGGCDLQHLAGGTQRMHKQQTVLDLLQRHAHLVPERLETSVSGEDYGYRRRARLAVQVSGSGQPGRCVGFRAAGSNQVVAVDDCVVLAPELARLPGALQTAIDGMLRPGAIGHAELMLSESSLDGRSAVIYLRCVEILESGDREHLKAFAQGEAATLAIREGEADIRYLYSAQPEGPGYLLPEFSLRIGFEPGDFLQGNAQVNRLLVNRVIEWLDPLPRERLLDAFSGLGNFSLPLARQGFDVLGIEGDAALVKRAARNAQANRLENVRFLTGDLFEMSRPLPKQPLVAALLDPPRQGADTLIAELARRRVSPIVYVSCQPATLARDAARLAQAGYRLKRLALVDMFPQTGHIETLAYFAR
ncbi:MAG: methyltransferase domain-containing protein [Pseudomonadales bacterium]